MLHNLTGRVLPAGINPIYRQSLLFLPFCLSHSLCNSSCVSAERAWVLWSTGVISPATFEKCPVNALKPECSISPRRKCQKVLSLPAKRVNQQVAPYELLWMSVEFSHWEYFPTFPHLKCLCPKCIYAQSCFKCCHFWGRSWFAVVAPMAPVLWEVSERALAFPAAGGSAVLSPEIHPGWDPG